MAPQAVCLGKQYKLSKRPVNVPKTVRLTNGLTRLERETRPRRTAGPGPARVLVHWGETWSHPRGTLGRCHKGSEINIILFFTKVLEKLRRSICCKNCETCLKPAGMPSTACWCRKKGRQSSPSGTALPATRSTRP